MEAPCGMEAALLRLIEGEWRVDRRPEPGPEPALVDVTRLLGPGVYILWWGGKLRKMAWTKSVLDRIAAHRSLIGRKVPDWMPVKGIHFDKVAFYPCAEDKAESVMAKLKMELKGESATAA